MAIFDPIYAPKIKEGEEFFDLLFRRTKIGAGSSILGPKNENGEEFFALPAPKDEDETRVLRSSGSKIVESSIRIRRTFNLRRTPSPIFEETPSSKNPVPSSIFGAEDRRTAPSHLRSLEPKSEEPSPSSVYDLCRRRSKNPPSIFDLRPRRMVRRSDGRQGKGATSSKMGGGPSKMRGSSIFLALKNEGPPSIFHLLDSKIEGPLLPPSRFDEQTCRTQNPEILRAIVKTPLVLGPPGGLHDLIGYRLYIHSPYLLYPGHKDGRSKKICYECC